MILEGDRRLAIQCINQTTVVRLGWSPLIGEFQNIGKANIRRAINELHTVLHTDQTALFRIYIT